MRPDTARLHAYLDITGVPREQNTSYPYYSLDNDLVRDIVEKVADGREETDDTLLLAC